MSYIIECYLIMFYFKYPVEIYYVGAESGHTVNNIVNVELYSRDSSKRN